MWSNSLDSVEGIVGSVALIVTTTVGAWLTVSEAVRSKQSAKSKSAEQAVVQGQPVTQEKTEVVWLNELREDTDELRAQVAVLQDRLTAAKIRLAANGLPHEDI